MRWARNWQVWLIVAALVVGVVIWGHLPEELSRPRAQAKPTSAPAGGWLSVASQKDGDSFVATNGKEYRLGLVNAPELDEPCGREAREFSLQFLAAGFTVDAYSSDAHGRQVAEVFDRSGQSLNVALAESGLGNDKYLKQYRYENPDLAHRLDVAFAASAPVHCVPHPV